MAPLRNRATRVQNDQDHIFEGLPIRHWRKQGSSLGLTPEEQPVASQSPFPELPMPKDSHLLSEGSRALLRIARAPRVPKTVGIDDDEKEGDEEEGAKDSHRGVVVKKWAMMPKNHDAPERPYLAARRKGLPPLHGFTAYPDIYGTQAQGRRHRPVKVKRRDKDGVERIYEVFAPVGQYVEGEIVERVGSAQDPTQQSGAIAGTLIEGVGIVNAEGIVVAQSTPTRRKPPPPRRKPKKGGPGRSKKKIMPEFGPDGVPIGGVTGAPLPGSALQTRKGGENGVREGDVEMQDVRGDEDDEGDEMDEDEDEKEDGEVTPTPVREGENSAPGGNDSSAIPGPNFAPVAVVPQPLELEPPVTSRNHDVIMTDVEQAAVEAYPPSTSFNIPGLALPAELPMEEVKPSSAVPEVPAPLLGLSAAVVEPSQEHETTQQPRPHPVSRIKSLPPSPQPPATVQPEPTLPTETLPPPTLPATELPEAPLQSPIHPTTMEQFQPTPLELPPPSPSNEPHQVVPMIESPPTIPPAEEKPILEPTYEPPEPKPEEPFQAAITEPFEQLEPPSFISTTPTVPSIEAVRSSSTDIPPLHTETGGIKSPAPTPVVKELKPEPVPILPSKLEDPITAPAPTPALAPALPAAQAKEVEFPDGEPDLFGSLEAHLNRSEEEQYEPLLPAVAAEAVGQPVNEMLDSAATTKGLQEEGEAQIRGKESESTA